MFRPKTLYRPSVTLAIIKLNIAVYIAWMISLFYNPGFMIDHFLVSFSALVEGRYWTLLTSVFSHNMFFHIFLNMYAFFGFGAVVENVLGAKRFAIFYLMAGLIASISHCLVSALLIGNPQLAALGASGAVSGVILLFSLLFPKERILLLGIIPLPSLTAALIFVGLDIWGLIEQTQGGSLPIGHGAHLGGALYGLFYYFFFVRRSTSIVAK